MLVGRPVSNHELPLSPATAPYVVMQLEEYGSHLAQRVKSLYYQQVGDLEG